MRRRLTMLVAALALGAAACSVPGAPSAAPAGSGGTGTDTRYGAAPAAHPEVTYQPGVVIVGGGGSTVRSVSDDAMTWRIDPAAEGAAELEQGSIMFLTGRAVGRVLDARRDGADLAVTLGPVDITEVIRDGTFDGSNPVSFEEPGQYDAGSPFWAEIDVDGSGEPAPAAGEQPGGPGTGEGAPGGSGPPGAPPTTTQAPTETPTRPAAYRPGVHGTGTGAAFQVAPYRPEQRSPGMTVTPICCAGGVGARIGYDSNGVRLAGTVGIVMRKPSATFHLEIRGGAIRRADLAVTGMVGIKIDIAGATNTGRNVNKHIPIPVDFSVPVAQLLGVPFSVTVNQVIGLQTAFSSKDGNIKAAGEWALTGALGFGYSNGAFRASTPKNLTVASSITDSIRGVSVGVTGIIVHHQATFRVGLGAFGFAAGLYFTLTTSVGLAIGSAAGAPIELCRSAQLGIWAEYGVGYTMPPNLVKVINSFLQLVNVRPIEAKAGIGGTENVFNRLVIHPDVPICRA